jgi:hypothetical protein
MCSRASRASSPRTLNDPVEEVVEWRSERGRLHEECGGPAPSMRGRVHQRGSSKAGAYRADIVKFGARPSARSSHRSSASEAAPIARVTEASVRNAWPHAITFAAFVDQFRHDVGIHGVDFVARVQLSTLAYSFSLAEVPQPLHDIALRRAKAARRCRVG